MKKFTIGILAILYFTMTSGIVLNIHYCRGKISSVKVDVLAKDLCACKKKKDKGCCKTDNKLVKLEDTHKAAVTQFIVEAPVAIVTSSYNIQNTSFVDLKNDLAYNNHSPPDILSADKCILHCVFRI
jgi:hypothetical protein